MQTTVLVTDRHANSDEINVKLTEGYKIVREFQTNAGTLILFEKES
jgi:hypothetical protein